MGLCGYGMCQMRGAIRRPTLLKNVKGRTFHLSLVQCYYFFKVQVVPKPVTWLRGKSLLEKCQSLDDQIVRALLLLTLVYKTYAFKYLHLCPTLLTKFNSTHFMNLQYSICFIAFVASSWVFSALSSVVRLICQTLFHQSK